MSNAFSFECLTAAVWLSEHVITSRYRYVCLSTPSLDEVDLTIAVALCLTWIEVDIFAIATLIKSVHWLRVESRVIASSTALILLET